MDLRPPTAKRSPPTVIANFARYSSLARVSCASLLVLLLVTTATAGPLPVDGNAYVTGSVSLNVPAGTVVGGVATTKTLNAQVDYAVYAPGMFDLNSTINFPHNSPTNPLPSDLSSEYVYAYEILNNGTGSNATITALTLGLSWVADPGAIPNGWTQVGYDIGQDGTGATVKAPTSSDFKTTYPYHNVLWNFASSSSIGFGSHSEILLYTSPFAAQMTTSGLTGSAVSYTLSLPTPVPEPATAALALVAVICLLAAKCAQRRT